MVRNNELKKDKTSFGIIDAKSIKNADTAEQKGYDAGKKISGIKLHIVVDTLMLLIILCILLLIHLDFPMHFIFPVPM